MFGTNPLRKVEDDDGSSLWVQEVFGTIQGEGPFAGTPSIFVRLAGCNLACYFCDTDFETSQWKPTLDQLCERIEDERLSTTTDLVVLTGGEPLRQNVGPLIARLIYQNNMRVQIETAGTVWPRSFDADAIDQALVEGRVHIVCSPKTGTVTKGIRHWCRDYKYIVGADTNWENGVPTDSTQYIGRRTPLFKPGPDAQIWLQPREDYADGKPHYGRTDANMRAAVKQCMQRGYRLSLQIHKQLGLR